MCKRTLARLALMFGSIAIVILAAEASVRIVSDEPWYEKVAGVHARAELELFPIGDTELAMRRAPDTSPKPPGVTRVLFLGDSFTYAMGVPEDEGFVAATTKTLVEQDGRALESFNGGIPGSMTKSWRQLFEDMGEAYEPDLVVVVFFLRDGVAGLTTQGLIRGIRDRLRLRAEESWLYRTSGLFRLVESRRAQQRLSDSYLGSIEAGYAGTPSQVAEWSRAQENLLTIRDRSEAMGAKFVLVIFPVLFGLDQEPYPVQAAIDAIQTFAEENEIATLSLLPAFRGQDAPDLWVSTFDQHPNALAHRLAAEAITPFVSSKLDSE